MGIKQVRNNPPLGWIAPKFVPGWFQGMPLQGGAATQGRS